MKIALLNLYYAPDEAATAQMLADLGSALAAAGHEVRAICGDRAYGNPKRRYPRRETIDAVEVVRVRSSGFGRGTRLGRLLDYFTYFTGAASNVFTRRSDVLISLTTPPLIGLLGVAARFRSILWSMDVYPELAFALGAMSKRSLLGRLLSQLSRLAYRRSDVVVALGPNMARKLESASSEITIIPNWADGRAIRPRPVEGHPFRKEWGWQNRFVVLYAGNLGLAHEFETVLEAAREFREDRSIHFAFVGAGPRLDQVRKRSHELELSNVEFGRPLPREKLGELLTAGDLHLVTLRPEVVGLLVPSKLYGILASGRPLLYVGPPEGETFEIVNGKHCGEAVSNGDVDGVVRAIRAYAASPGRREMEGRRSREVFEREFTRKMSVEKWISVIEGGA